MTREDVYQRNVRRRLEGPTADHILGAVNLDRDILKRTFYATPFSLQLALSAAGMAIVIGFSGGADKKLDAPFLRGKLQLLCHSKNSIEAKLWRKHFSKLK